MKDNVHENLQPDLHQSRHAQEDLGTGTGKTTFDSESAGDSEQNCSRARERSQSRET